MTSGLERELIIDLRITAMRQRGEKGFQGVGAQNHLHGARFQFKKNFYRNALSSKMSEYDEPL
jgi:hypothetical protein